MAVLVNTRWVDIPEDEIYDQLRTLGIRDWHTKALSTAGLKRLYLFGGQYAYPYSLPQAVITRLADRLNGTKDMTWYKKYNSWAIAHFEATGLALNQAQEYWYQVGNPALPKPEIKPVDGLTEGDEYIAIIGLFHLIGNENNNNHHLFIDLIDRGGNRIYGHTPPLELYYGWRGITTEQKRQTKPVRIDKPDNEPGANIGLTWDQVICCFHINNIATDRLDGVHVRYESDGPGNERGHHSHYLVLQKRTYRSPDPGQPPDPEPEPEPPEMKRGEWVSTLAPDADGYITIRIKPND